MAIIDKIQLSGTVYTIGNETTTAVTSASTDNEIPTAKAVYDAIPQGGGGKAIEAGTNISITTGDTADTINCTLNISNGTGTKSIKIGDGVTASGILSFAQGYEANASGNWSAAFGRGKSTNNYTFSANNGEAKRGYSSAFGSSIANNTYGFATGAGSKANGHSSFVSGWYTNSNNDNEAAFGIYNNSVSASTTFGDSGNTLFSVGNGNDDNKRHNAFEIRQNGDIYIADTNDTSTTNYYEKPMIKLQDALGGGGSTYTAGDGIDITNDVISVTGKVDTSAITTTITSSSTDAQVPSAKAVNDKLGGLSLVKLTQSEYDALSPNYDANTLYVING